MRICHVVPSLEERHGGPSKSVRALANAQAALSADVTLLSTLEPGQPAPQLSGDSARILVFDRDHPRRFCRSAGLRRTVLTPDWDCLHSHALWLLPLHYAQVSARKNRIPLVISPRGMLSIWAYGHHRWKKKLAELLIHPGAFASVAGWHATSEAEAAEIRGLGFRQPVCIAPNGVEVPADYSLAAAREAWWQVEPALRYRRVAVFYSRLHRKKRVLELIQQWGSEPRGDWVLLVAGVPEEYSVAELQSAARRYAGETVVVCDATGLPPPYSVAELFLLPSHSENFGLVVAEALASGLPALVTDTTPWQGLDKQHAGHCVSWEDYPAALRRLLALPSSDLVSLGQSAREWVRRDFTWQSAARRLLDFYAALRHV